MGKTQPPNTKGHQLFIPNELHGKLKLLASYGTVDDFIIKCIEAGMAPHWRDYVSQEYARLNPGEKGENGQKAIRPSSPPDAREVAAKKKRRADKAKA
jgi:hypothetical protein